MRSFAVMPPLLKQASEEETRPTEFALDQNYPNPFNPETTIRFHLPEDAHVQVKVFDSIGREVAELANAQYAAGSHTVAFNAKNLASGVYHYKIKAGKYETVKKMMLVK